MNYHKYLVLFSAAWLSSCSWVETTKEGEAVTVVRDAAELQACKKLASTTSTVLDKLGFVDRTESLMIDELTTLAKNKAAELGGDTIISSGPVKEGSMKFDIYKCNN